MSIPVCQVLVTLIEPGGVLVGASVTAKLSGPIIYEGVVVPVSEMAITDQYGKCTLQLCPTSLGPTPRTYSFEIWAPSSPRPIFFHDIAVPLLDSTTLEALLGFVPGNLTVWDDQLMWDEGDGTPQWLEA